MMAPEKLLALALDELDAAEADEVERHVLVCGACAARLERWLSLGDGVRQLVRAGRVRFSLSREMAEQLEQSGLITRVYRVSPGGSVSCTVDANDIYVAAYLSADLAGVTRVDLIKDSAGRSVRTEDLPFDVERGHVTWVVRGDYLRTMPTGPETFRLVAVDANGEREIARYVFNHTAFAG